MSIICFFCPWWKLSGLSSVWPEETKSPWHAQEDSKAFSRLLLSIHTECTGLLGIVSWQAKMNEDCCSYHQMLQKGGVGCRTREVQMFPLTEQVVSASEQCFRGFCKGAWSLFEVHREKRLWAFFSGWACSHPSVLYVIQSMPERPLHFLLSCTCFIMK